MKPASPFNPKLVAGIVVSALIAFLAFLLLLAFGGSLGSGSDGRAHALSRSAIGYSGIVRLVEAAGEARLVRDPADLDAEALLVVTLEPTSRPEAVAQLIGDRGGRITLIVLPKWNTIRDPDRSSWVRQVGRLETAWLDRLLPGVKVGSAPVSKASAQACGRQWLNGLCVPLPASAQLISGDKVEPMLVTPEGHILLGRLGNSPHFVLADPDLLNNHGLRDWERARDAVRLLQELNMTGAEATWFDLTLNGFGQEDSVGLLRLAFEPPFLAMTLALAIAAFLAGLHGLHRFGPIRPEPRGIRFGKAALVENSAGLVRAAGREAQLRGAYAEIVRQSAARAVAAPKTLKGADLESYLDRLPGAEPGAFSRMIRDLAAVGRRDELVPAARALFEWKRKFTP